jgi:predicted RNA-binding Zn ribbon-like protein
MGKIPENSKFIWVGNNAAIDFINTQIVSGDTVVDLLQDSAGVLRWLKESGQLTDAPAPRNLLEEARAYRAQLREGLERQVKGSRIPAALLAATNAYLSRRALWMQLEQKGSGYRLAAQFHPERAPDFMFPIAQSLAELLAEGDLSRFRKCNNPDCILFFYDLSKGNQRAWCSLEICGNKLRMAASRRRRAQ